MNRERQSPGNLFFLLAAKERTKENCRCFDAADPRLGGCTPPRPPKRKSEGAGAKRKQYYFSFLTPPPLPPPLSREFPRTPAGGRGRPPCQRGLAALAAWGIPTGFAWPPVTPADGQESLRLACARHLPLTREALTGFTLPPVNGHPPPFPKTLQTLHALHKTCPLFAKPLPRLYRTMVETGAKPWYN